MTPFHGLDPTIELRLGTRHRSLSTHDLARSLGVALPELRGALLGLLLRPPREAGAASVCPADGPCAPAMEGETTEGVVGNETNDETNDETITSSLPIYKTRTTNETNESGEDVGSRGEGAREATRIATYLAQVLHDPEGLSTFERLAAEYPPEHLKRALGLVLRVPPERIRQSRGAYFTALVRRLRPSR